MTIKRFRDTVEILKAARMEQEPSKEEAATAPEGDDVPDTGWVDAKIADAERELTERELPLRLRDKRAASDDGYKDYLTIAEETVRSVPVAATKEKLKRLKDYKNLLQGRSDNDDL